MRVLNILLGALCLIAFVGCGGGGDAASPAGDSNSSLDSDSPTPDNSNLDDGGDGSNPPPTEPPQVSGPKPGDLVAASEPSATATYPATGQALQPTPDPYVEPNTDYEIPIIEILSYPNNYIPSTNGTIQLAAADNEGGSGLKELQCSIDGGAWGPCDPQVDLTGLSEGNHTLEARAEDWDENVSGVVSYTFYVDTTPPEVEIKSAPVVATTEVVANFNFEANDEGSGVSKYKCQLDGGSASNCNPNELYSNLGEGMHNLQVTAVDNVGNESPAESYDWLVDHSAPVINVVQQPGSQVYVDDPSSVINFNVSDQYSPNGITTTCTLNGKAVACASGTNLTSSANQPETFTLVIVATDVLGNSSSQTLSWTAVNETENRSSTITVDDERPVDILFVVDNSGSMDEERANLAQRIDGMIDIIKDLNWQIGVISTDASNNDAKSDGRLIELIGLPGEYILDASMDVATAQSIFGTTVQNFGGGSGREEGIYSTKRLIDRYLAGEDPYVDFLRDGADLSVVVLSDEDESSNGGDNRITPQGFLDFANVSFNNQKNVIWHSIIWRPGDSGCSTGYNVGNIYDELSRLTGYGDFGGAIIGDVCSNDYTSQLQDIGQSVKDLRNSIQLECAPHDSDKDGMPEVTIQYRANAGANYAPFTASHLFQSDRIIFDDLLPPGDYKVDYKCKIN